MITKRGRDLNDVELTAETGTQKYGEGRASYGTRFESGLEALFSSSFQNSHGAKRIFFPEFNSSATNDGFAENADADQASSLFADIIYRDFNIHALHSSRTKHIPTASLGTVFNDSRTRATDARSYVDIQLATTH